MAASIREKQTDALKRMLNFNNPLTKASMAEPQWKILVYDKCGQDIISPLLPVKALRDMGVTLHMLIDSKREQIPDVPAIYFVMPTPENIKRIQEDFHNQMYESYYLNFTTAISRQKLEDIALAAIQNSCVTQVSKVFDQYLNFISLEDDMFVLKNHRQEQSVSSLYYDINKGDVKDTEMEAIIDSVVDSLFCTFVTLGQVPIIRCSRGNAAEMVGEKLDKKLRENVRDARNSLFTSDTMTAGQLSFQRPLLVILDRNLDLATPFHHTWTYQALAHDVLNLTLNRVEIKEETTVQSPAGARVENKSKSYDLNPTDWFWRTHKGSPFPAVAEAVQEALDSYRNKEDEVKRLKSAMGLDGEDDHALAMMPDNTAKLTSAVSSLPELLEEKRLIDMHMNVATGLLENIKSRKLDIYFETEERLMSKSTLDKSIMDIITDPEAGKCEDKERLFIINLICGTHMSEAEINQYCDALRDAGCDTSAIDYIRRWRSFTKASISTSAYAGGGTKTISMFSKLMSQASQFAMEGVKNLVVKKHNLPATKVADALMEMKSSPETDDFRYFDPKIIRGTDGSMPRNRDPFQEAVVFVVGGGNYIEYQNLVDYCKSKGAHYGKKIIYGCTDLLNGDQFLQQLRKLGQEM